MAQSSKEPKFTLRLVVDEEKNKVVFAEACRDFVDVLFRLLTLPMGVIIRLLEKNPDSQPITVGCFNNLYRSFVELGIDDLEIEACKQMLMYPRNPTKDVKFFRCRCFSKKGSNFSTCRCRSGQLMNKVTLVSNAQVVDNTQNSMLISGRSAFIITDDLQVAVMSTGLVLERLKSLGCADVSKLGERLVDIGFKEVMTLLQCIFSSNAPLTDTFLNNQIPQGVMKTCDLPSLYMKRKGEEAEAEEVITLNAIVRKHDMKILYVECGEDFVDLLFSYLAVPLEDILELYGNIFDFRCIGNLYRNYKDVSANKRTTSKSVVPYYYRCQEELELRNIIGYEEPVDFTYGDYEDHGSGFVKRDTKFTVSDDLIVTPFNSSSIISLLKKLQSQAEDLEVQEISISKAEATNLLRDSLVTSSALNTCLRNLILKKPKEEI